MPQHFVELRVIKLTRYDIAQICLLFGNNENWFSIT